MINKSRLAKENSRLMESQSQRIIINKDAQNPQQNAADNTQFLLPSISMGPLSMHQNKNEVQSTRMTLKSRDSNVSNKGWIDNNDPLKLLKGKMQNKSARQIISASSKQV